MKKLLTITASLGLAVAAFGQGQVNFANSSAAASKISQNSALGGALTGLATAGANSYYYELFIAPYGTLAAGTAEGANGATGFQAVDPTSIGFVDTGFEAASTATAGRLAMITAGDSQGYADMTAVNASYGAGDSADLLVVGWSANLGTNWTTVKADIDAGNYSAGTPGATWVGESVVGAIVLGGGSTPVSGIPAATTAPGFGLYLVQVPEPATFALCGLGAAALVIFRRRN